MSSGETRYENLGPSRATAAAKDPNMVTIGGMQTSRVVAEQMGWTPDDEVRSWKNIPDHMGESNARGVHNKELPGVKLEDPQEVKTFEKNPDATFEPTEMTQDIKDGQLVMADLDRF